VTSLVPPLRAFLLAEREASPADHFLLDNGRGEMAFYGPEYLRLAFRRHLDFLHTKKLISDPKGIKPFHGFRAFFITYLFNDLHVDLPTIQKWVGHSSITVTLGYIADPERKLYEAGAKITAIPALHY